MPLNIDSFRNIANQTSFGSRDVVVRGEGENATARLGNFIFSHSAKTNDATMAAFKDALEKAYGVFGTHAFDTVLGARVQMHKSLRACDITATLSKLDTVKTNRYIGELNRQLDTNPKFRELSEDMRKLVRSSIVSSPIDGDLSKCETQADISHMAAKRIDRGIESAKDFVQQKKRFDPNYKVSTDPQTLEGRKETETEVKANEPTGLRRLKTAFGSKETSIEDQIKKGFLGSGMRVNRSNTNPVILEKLKSNGVEPGFIYRNDWSKDDTRGYMADVNSEASHAALDALKLKDQAFVEKCEGKSHRDQILLAGRAHPAAMAAAAELLIEEAAKLAIEAKAKGKTIDEMKAPDAVKNLAKAIKGYCSDAGSMESLSKISEDGCDKALLDKVKKELFTDIRDAVMGVEAKNPDGTDSALYARSPVFKHFSDRAIVKLDYNEGCKFSSGDSAHAGTFMRPERILNSRKPILGQIYRFTSRQSADTISAGAVTEALANDLTRIAGVPAQELEIVRGEYSDGHPKIMLAAKFAEGYKDMEAGMLKDGRIVKPANADPKLQMESLGKYKAFFLVTADRDGVGKRGQNKGFIGGKFFAIDPGHSLEGNGKYLKVSSDLSFKDTYGKSSKPRFNNFSVFDDDTFFSKLEGVLNMRELFKSGAFKKVFDEYREAFNPNADGISEAEKALRQKIVADISKKEAEFNESMKKILDVSVNNLDLYDDLSDKPESLRQAAVETVSNLEKLTSPTTWVSKKGKVALQHLEVIPETRVPWKAALKGDNIVYFTETKMSYANLKQLEEVVTTAGAKFDTDTLGVTRITVPVDKAEKFFAVFNEEKVQQITHAAEYMARKDGSSGLKEATIYKPVPYPKPVTDPRPLIDLSQLPPYLDFEVDGQVYKFPKIHFQDLLFKSSSVHRPRNEAELRALLSAQVKLGREVLGALMSGRPGLFEPTNQNIVALTYALHAAALKKGEFMFRGSFSISDKNGDIARWLDKAQNLYIRTSTHAKPYQTAHVDGHLNMPRGYDVPTGAGGLLNGMRTFHFFTIPDEDGLKNGGNGNGPRRRLFLKCETFGIFCSTAHARIYDKPASVAEGMKTRGYRFGDVLESIFHGASLFGSFFRLKEASGIRKENLTTVQKNAILLAQNKLRTKYPQLAERLTTGDVLDGAGINKMIDNMAWILDHMPEDEDERAWITNILDDMFTPMEGGFGNEKYGDAGNRIGNEIMIDAKDIG